MKWVAKKILDKKKVNGKWKVLISWKGFGPESNTWEDYNEIKKYYPEMIEHFDIKNK